VQKILARVRKVGLLSPALSSKGGEGERAKEPIGAPLCLSSFGGEGRREETNIHAIMAKTEMLPISNG
jgi:hypothetical protein